MAINNLDGYPIQVANKNESIIDLDGPASYNNTGAFATSGQILNALDLGYGGFESVDVVGGLSSDQLNTVLVVLNPQSPGDAAASARIHWFVQSTGAEVANAVNLSGKSIRLQIRGV